MSAWRELARTAESLGYSALYVTDHLDAQYGPLVAATVAAEATSSLHIGTAVLNNDLRNPVVLAKEIATLGLAAEGRIEVGLGAGWLRRDYQETGIDYDSPETRIDRLSESLTIMKGLWNEGQTTFEGRHYTVLDARCHPRPASPPAILVGGGSKRVLTLAAKQAEIVNVSLKSGENVDGVSSSATLDHFDRCLGWVRDAAGVHFGELDLQITVIAATEVNSRRAAVRIATMLGFSGEDALSLPVLLLGTQDEICERLLESRERWGFSSVVLPGESMAMFAPVVARLTGK